MQKYNKLKGLFIGSLLPTEKNPEAGIFYYKLIFKLKDYLDEIYVIYPKKINTIFLNNNDKSLYRFSSIFKRPYFISLGFLRHFKIIYKYINFVCFLSFYLAIKRSFKKNFSKKYINPDFIYSHFISPAGLAGAILSKEMKIPCFVAVGESSLDYLNNLPRKFLFSYLNNIDFFISVNKKNAAILNEKYSINKKLIYIIPNEADEKIFFKQKRFKHKKELNLSENKKNILFVGSLTYRKGFDIFLKLAESNSNYNFIVIGRDPGRLYLNLNKIKNINYIGVKSQKIIAKYMNSCDLFALYSRYEGSPNVLIEAKATGLPILCSNINEHKELLGEDQAFYSSTLDDDIIDDLDIIFDSEKYKSLTKKETLKKSNSLSSRGSQIMDIINKHI